MDWKSTWKLEFQSNVFDDVRNRFVSAHCIVTSIVLTVTDENHKLCLFPILPVFLGLILLAKLNLEERLGSPKCNWGLLYADIKPYHYFWRGWKPNPSIS